jgi:curved DNA-binding protein CbpA
MASYYDVLGVGADADFEEVRRAYHRTAQLVHPDRYAGSPDPERRRAEAEMKALNEAWNTLRDPEARRRYDIHLGLIDADGEDGELGDGGLWVDAEQPRPSLFRSRGVRLAVAVVVIAGVVASAIVVLSPPDNHSARWSVTATADLRSAAIKAGMTAPQADCFVQSITTRYGPSDAVDRAVIQQVGDACR